MLILAFGAYFARFVGAAVTAYCKNVGISDAELLGRLAHYAIMAFVILIALDQLGLRRHHPPDVPDPPRGDRARARARVRARRREARRRVARALVAARDEPDRTSRRR